MKRGELDMAALYVIGSVVLGISAAWPSACSQCDPHSIGRMPSLSSSAHVAVAAGVRRGEQLRPVENRIGAGEKAQRLRLLAHVLAAGREPHHRGRHGDARDRDGAHEIERIELPRRSRAACLRPAPAY